jgi:hypothetical protein
MPKRLTPRDIVFGQSYFCGTGKDCCVVTAVQPCALIKGNILIECQGETKSVPASSLEKNNFKTEWAVSRWHPLARIVKEAAAENNQKFSWLDY